MPACRYHSKKAPAMTHLHNGIVVGMGELLWDELPTGARLGGAPANFAYHTSQLGHKAAVISAVGNDPLGHEAITLLESRGVTPVVTVAEAPTGTVGVRLNASGVPEYDIRRNAAWDCIEPTADARQAISRAAAVCWGTLAQRDARSRQAIRQLIAEAQADTLKICDVNLRSPFYSAEIIADSLEMCNIIKINDEELQLLQQMHIAPAGAPVEAAIELAKRYEASMVILTCGADCSYAIKATGETSAIATPRVPVADTVGAGDSFTAAFTAAWLNGAPMEKAHQLAVEVSAYVCTCAGAMPVLPAELIEVSK